MSPRMANPATRTALLEATAQLLAEEGPASLSIRRLATKVGVSTMAIYTYFGAKEDVIREVVREGFAKLAKRLADVPATDDPVADLAEMSRTYRSRALADPALYTAMLGGSSSAGFFLSEEDRHIGSQTLGVAVQTIRQCIDAGRFRPVDPLLLAQQLSATMHGLVALELNGYFIDPQHAADTCFEAMIRNFAVGAGDSYEAATNSCSKPSNPMPAGDG